MKIENIIVEEAEERPGNLPYIVMWISAGNYPSLEHYSTLSEAIDQYRHLATCGCRPSLLRLVNVRLEK